MAGFEAPDDMLRSKINMPAVFDVPATSRPKISSAMFTKSPIRRCTDLDWFAVVDCGCETVIGRSMPTNGSTVIRNFRLLNRINAAVAIALLRSMPDFSQASRIGVVQPQGISLVTIHRTLGREQPLDDPLGAPLPRIC